MATSNPLRDHRNATRELADSLTGPDVYKWLIQYGYYPESFVLPPCFAVTKCPQILKQYFPVTQSGKRFTVDREEWVNVHFPRSEFTDRNFGIMHPKLHNDIAYHIGTEWNAIVRAMLPDDSKVVTYSFPIPIDAKCPGRIGHLRSGRMIYEFIGMTEDDIASVAYRYSHLIKTDIKNFYPSIYTHSIAWALHGKTEVRNGENLYNYNLLGNRLDKLFMYTNDACTNGIAIGPVVSDVIAEIIASAVDRILTEQIKSAGLDCEVVRFKDDYRILAKSEGDGKTIIKYLQAALKFYNLELNDDKTAIAVLPDGLFREWVSMYHAVHPRRKRKYSWKDFRELYLAVLRIDRACPGTGVIDRFLADIITRDGTLKVQVASFNLQKVLSMLLMLATLRIKAFPKVVAIIEAVLRSPFGRIHESAILEYLENYLRSLSEDEERNKYLISWISYFLVSNDLDSKLSFKPTLKDPITRSVFTNKGTIFKDLKDFNIFVDCREAAKNLSMLQHLDVFDPPRFP